MDRRLFDLAKILKAKIIISSRDPRDCAVSLSERFNFDINTILIDLSHSYSCILSMTSDVEILKLHYDVDLLFNAKTVRSIVDFVGCDLGDAVIEKISLEFSRAAVAEKITELGYSGDPVQCFEPDTHWHLNHVGDGQTGKWRDRLDPLHTHLVEAAILPMDSADDPQGLTLLWPAAALHHDGSRENATKMVFYCDGADHRLVWGPYYRLPPGRWTAEYLIEPGDIDLTIRIEIHEAAPSRGSLGVKTVALGQHHPNDLKIEFDHLDQAHPVEARIFAIADENQGSFLFAGVKLTRTGAAPQRKFKNANQIRQCAL